MEPAFFLLLGYPEIGKLTIAGELVRWLEAGVELLGRWMTIPPCRPSFP